MRSATWRISVNLNTVSKSSCWICQCVFEITRTITASILAFFQQNVLYELLRWSGKARSDCAEVVVDERRRGCSKAWDGSTSQRVRLVLCEKKRQIPCLPHYRPWRFFFWPQCANGVWGSVWLGTECFNVLIFRVIEEELRELPLENVPPITPYLAVQVKSEQEQKLVTQLGKMIRIIGDRVKDDQEFQEWVCQPRPGPDEMSEMVNLTCVVFVAVP